MDVYLKPLAAGVLALVGLLVIIALFVTHPTWLVPTVVTMAGINLAILLAVAGKDRHRRFGPARSLLN